MKNCRVYLLLAISLLFLSAFTATAANIDPSSDGSRFAWGENIGWINFAPQEMTGVTVTDTSLSGVAWGENIGWILLSYETGGVVNDGNGNLSGYAWSENAGWIDFKPIKIGRRTVGVTIDACGDFNGYAWGENVGWISFRNDGSNPFRIRTSWKSPVDLIAPVTTLTPAVQPWYRTDASFTLAATDCGAGVKELHYSINGVETITPGSSAIATVTTEGCNSFSYYAVDSASTANSEAARELQICIDKSQPIIHITIPPENATYYINSPITPVYSITDAVSGVASSQIGTFSTATAGSHSFTVSATDVVGNATSVTRNYTILYPGNVDPGATGCQYAWSENTGWINFKPDFGPGVSVSTTAVTGLAWGENIGWIVLDPAGGGVVNDGAGNLSGYAWSENAGWIDFGPTGAGVKIASDGSFSGYAWGENIGWISFSTANACLKTVSQKPGDCDGNGQVSIAEVQAAINMYLGLMLPVQTCVDTDNSGTVSIAEVQKVINGYLGL